MKRIALAAAILGTLAAPAFANPQLEVYAAPYVADTSTLTVSQLAQIKGFAESGESSADIQERVDAILN